MSINQRIRVFIDSRNITSYALAKMIGSTPQTLANIMSEKNEPSCSILTKILSKYNEIDANWLLKGEGEMLLDNAPPPAVNVGNVNNTNMNIGNGSVNTGNINATVNNLSSCQMQLAVAQKEIAMLREQIDMMRELLKK